MVDNSFTKVGTWVFDSRRGDYVFKECSNVVVSFPDDDGFVKFKDNTNSRPLDFKGENKPTYDLLKPVYMGVDFGKGIMLDPKDKKRKEPFWKKLPKKGKKGRKNWEI